jgi:hypothetical protein
LKTSLPFSGEVEALTEAEGTDAALAALFSLHESVNIEIKSPIAVVSRIVFLMKAPGYIVLILDPLDHSPPVE